MTGPVLSARNLGKRYRIGGSSAAYGTLRDALERLFSRQNRGLEDQRTEVWALRHVDLDVMPGEVVGVVGRNGAGKSTLLKILSRITRPTEGSAVIRGRVGSLLEVGTGFHPELTGRENVFLNGAILGMSRADINRRFDAIVAFSEIERFLDTPVKHYSSGMHMRLAFSVAAHLEPDVLVVDEVLAVGDAFFQRKCLGLMGEVSRQGRTVLFVSHSIPALLNLCTRGVLLEGGQLTMSSDIRSVADRYLSHGDRRAGFVDLRIEGRPRYGGELAFLEGRIVDGSGSTTPRVNLTEGFELRVRYRVIQPILGCQVTFSLWNGDGHCIFQSTDLDRDPSQLTQTREAGIYQARCFVSSTYLRAGAYMIDVAASVPGVRMLDQCLQALTFDVVDMGSVETRLAQGRLGVIAPVLEWQTEPMGTIDAGVGSLEPRER